LTLGEIEITDALTIDGSSAGGLLVVTGDANDDDVTVDLEFSAGQFTFLNPTEITNVAASTDNLLDDNSRVFNISSSTAATTINGLTITGGRTTGTSESGGGILSAADLTLIDSNVSGNSAAGTAASGGGIASNGSLRIVDSTVSQNVASGNGGGIQANNVGSTTTVIGSALFGNSAASGFGGAIFGLPNSILYVTNTTLAANSAANGSAIASVTGGSVLLTNSTVTGNFSPDGSTIHGVSNAITLANSVILGNILFTGSEIVSVGGATQTVTGPTIVGTNLLHVGSSSTSLGGSVFAVASNVFVETIDYINTNGDGVKQPLELATSDGAIAGNLAFNGGQVLTVALKIDSSNPALDAGSDDRLNETTVGIDLDGNGTVTGSISSDARSESRFVDQPGVSSGPGVIDLGAFEAFVPAADFDEDNDVDGFDFLAWQRGFGTESPLAAKSDGDADHDNDVDSADLGFWQDQYGQVSVGGSVAASSSIEEAQPALASTSVQPSRAELIDAAMALDSAGGFNRVATATFVEQPFTEPTDAEQFVTQRSNSSSQAKTSTNSLTHSSEDEESSTEDRWLTNELLDRVFE